MSSIIETLYKWLYAGIILGILFFTIVGFYFYQSPYWTVENGVTLVGSSATTITLIFLSGTNIIPVAFKKYETSTQPRLQSLKQYLIASRRLLINPESSPQILDDLSDYLGKVKATTIFLSKHGKFFVTKLYPQETIMKTESLSKNLQITYQNLHQLSKAFSGLMISQGFNYSYDFVAIIFETRSLDKAPYKRKAVIQQFIKDNEELVEQLRGARNQFLEEFKTFERELVDFMDAN